MPESVKPVPSYAWWGDVPDHLRTTTQLAALDLPRHILTALGEQTVVVPGTDAAALIVPSPREPGSAAGTSDWHLAAPATGMGTS
ncbi:hypothetical protein F7Q99_29050 [Streptomyces kaniharaensis]|uniref:Uncharacterized protein n=1 Tax=Streptomyces kaniharaensis TaxID=212423 RepID=A0A6N7L0T4_9ACTN|nr:hypothetical protein [Streptomyces kaniharaensis]MQS16168.1 hypothetical protein [Streptomyces kaniharaensis]